MKKLITFYRKEPIGLVPVAFSLVLGTLSIIQPDTPTWLSVFFYIITPIVLIGDYRKL